MVEPGYRLKRLGIDHLISFFGSARTEEGDRFYDEAHELAYNLGEWAAAEHLPLGISSGGGPGIMEAVNRGAKESSSPSIGMGISLPFEQRNNEFVAADLDFEFHYFFTRKYWCTYLAKAFVVMPGGLGTMDELFEILTLLQTDKLKLNVPIVLYGRKFWKSVINFDTMLEHKTISESDVDRFVICDDVESAADYVKANIAID